MNMQSIQYMKNIRRNIGNVAGKRQQAFVLLPSLIFVLLLLLLALYMMRGVNIDEKMSSNAREKSRATEIAQSAMNYAEWWLQQPNNATTGIGASCTGNYTSPTVLPLNCTAPTLTDVQTLKDVQTNTALPGSATYTPSELTINAAGGSAAQNMSNPYYAAPTYSIYYLGQNASGQFVYSIYASGYGGNAESVAVLQSIFYVDLGTKSLG